MSSPTLWSVYHGFWIDWTVGKWQGCLLTLPTKTGGYLQSFTAVFTTLISALLWDIVVVGVHYCRSTKQAEDGLKHQQQVIIRNSTASGAAVSFLKQIWHWRGKANHSRRRSIGWAFFAGAFVVVSGVFGTLSAEVRTRTSKNRLVSPNNCGFSSYTDSTGQINSTAYGVSQGYDATAAASYARTCYNSLTADFDQCKRYTRPGLAWTGTEQTACPFESGICSDGNQAAFTLRADGIDSLKDLGINSHPSDRLILQKKMVCSSIREVDHYHQNGSLVYYDFGAIVGVPLLQGSTFVYNRIAEAALVSYSLSTTYSINGFPSEWVPIAALNRTDADVSIVFISANDVIYTHPNQDPVFSATKAQAGFTTADYDTSTLACAEQYQVCKADAQTSTGTELSCSSWMGAFQIIQQFDHLNSSLSMSKTSTIPLSAPLWNNTGLEMSAGQLAVLGRIAYVLPQTSLYNAISTQRASALRLQESVAGLFQTKALPDNYWTFEIGWWFDACLARLQEGIMSFAIGPSDPAGSNSTTLFGDKEFTRLCQRQLTLAAGDRTVNFSVLGLGILYGTGLLIFVLSIYIERLVRLFIARFSPSKSFKSDIWDANGLKHLQATIFNTALHEEVAPNESLDEDRDAMIWDLGEFPTTRNDEKMVHFSIISTSH